MNTVQRQYEFRKFRTRRKIFGTMERPRLTVYRSLKHIYAQIIDDVDGKTLVAATSNAKGVTGTGVKIATAVGEIIGKKAIEKGIKQVVFDRGARAYHGRIKALADGARSAGLKF